MGLLEGFRFAIDSFELIVFASVRGGFLCPEPFADLNRLPHHSEPYRIGRPTHAPIHAFVVAPTGADTELETATRNDIKGGGHISEEAWVPIEVA
jgi:hypothetical protein